MPEGAAPIALAYAGHQFGHFVPQLGDGRAILLGEIVGRDGVRRDIQLKGSGRTPFSRDGDGRAALGPVLREYIVSEAMAALGVPTTRALAAVTTGEPVRRETMLPGAVLTRVAASHIRVGTFQYFAARGDTEALRLLADHVIARHYPEAATAEHPYRALLDAVVARQADLVARWLLIGFIHGVMNTDNTSIAGETIDYGPCAFMDAYDPATVFSSIDHLGRYAYGNQPSIAQWNLARLAETLLPLLAEDEDQAVAAAKEVARLVRPAFPGGLPRRPAAQARPRHGARGRRRAGPRPAGAHGGERRRLHLDLPPPVRRGGGSGGRCAVRALFADPAAYDAWAARWRRRLTEEPGEPDARRAAMRAVNPAFIPRNHLVEAALDAAVTRQDFGPVRGTARGRVAARTRIGRATSATPRRPRRRSASTRPSAAPDIRLRTGWPSDLGCLPARRNCPCPPASWDADNTRAGSIEPGAGSIDVPDTAAINQRPPGSDVAVTRGSETRCLFDRIPLVTTALLAADRVRHLPPVAPGMRSSNTGGATPSGSKASHPVCR